MTNELAKIESVLLTGNLATLSPDQKIQYHNKVCELVGLNPLTKPFDYLTFQGKTVLYANKNCAEQLRNVHEISITDCKHTQLGDQLIVTVKAKSIKTGREDVATAAITTASLKGDNLANAIMKAETKAKRRVTLSICSLGMLDESEIETIPGAQKVPVNITPRAGDVEQSIEFVPTYFQITSPSAEQETFLEKAEIENQGADIYCTTKPVSANVLGKLQKFLVSEEWAQHVIELAEENAFLDGDKDDVHA